MVADKKTAYPTSAFLCLISVPPFLFQQSRFMSKTKSGLGTAEIVGIAIIVVVLMIVFNSGGGGQTNIIPLGTPMPELLVEGWVNGETVLSSDSLRGKVVLVDSWATWCPPCRASMPKLAKINAKYRDLGVQFIGLTPEGETDRAAIEGFIGTVEGFDWPVGYGATPTLDMLGVNLLPTIVVFGKDGRASWSSTSTQGLEVALDEALAR